MSSKNEMANKVWQKINPHEYKIEAFLSLLFIIGLVLRFTTDLPANAIVVVALCSFGAFYNIKGFAVVDRSKENRLGLVGYVGLSVAAFALLFKVQHWPGGGPMSIYSGIALLVSGGYTAYQIVKGKDDKVYNRQFLWRIVIAFSIILLLYLK